MHIIVAAIVEGVMMSIFLAIIAHYVILALGRDSIGIIPLASIALIAGLVSGIVLSLLIVVLAFAGYRRGMDPDNITGPIATTAGDLLAMFALFMAAEIVLGVI